MPEKVIVPTGDPNPGAPGTAWAAAPPFWAAAGVLPVLLCWVSVTAAVSWVSQALSGISVATSCSTPEKRTSRA